MYGPCGTFTTSNEAEAIALKMALDNLIEIFRTQPAQRKDIVIFTDNKIILRNSKRDEPRPQIASIIRRTNSIDRDFKLKIFLQWIPGHSDSLLHNRADEIAKDGSKLKQTEHHTSLESLKGRLKSIYRVKWIKQWANCNTGRSVWKYQKSPNNSDPWWSLRRKDQTTISRIRTKHCPTKSYLKRM
ncbi:unnamed protein product, partial [Lymnaea stagnalis]